MRFTKRLPVVFTLFLIIGMAIIAGTAMADNPPEIPANPTPPNGSTTMLAWMQLGWDQANGATSYDIYIWPTAQAKPTEPTDNITEIDYFPYTYLDFGTDYTWQVVARNAIGDTPGPEWTFSTQTEGQTIPTPAFDISPSAQDARLAIYDQPGRDILTGEEPGYTTPLEQNIKISLFGDSITWQNAYPQRIRNAIASSSNTSGLNVTIYTRGINGGTSLDIRDGIPGTQDPFADVIASDDSDVAVLFIGINDVWWAGTSEAAFEQALRDIVASAQSAGITFVMGTPALLGEKPDGTNSKDPQIDTFSEICREVAEDTQVTFLNIREACISYLQNHNYILNPDGTISIPYTQGILTYDGVHPTDLGNDLLADHISLGIYNALANPILPSEIDVSPMSHDFGDWGVGAGPTATQQITITNAHGENDLRIFEVSLSGNNPGHFGIDWDSGESVLGPGEERIVQVYFDPFSEGAKTANLKIRSNDEDEPITNVSLTGGGVILPIIRDVALNSLGNIEITFEGGTATWNIESSTSPYDYDESNMTWAVEAAGLSSGIWEDISTPSAGEKYYRLIPAEPIPEIIAYEPFDYIDGSNINGQMGSKGWNDAWYVSPAYHQSETTQVPGLSYPDLPTSGGALHIVTTTDTPTSVCERNMLNSIGTNDTTIWISYLYHAINMGAGHTFLYVNNAQSTAFGKRWGNTFAIDNQVGPIMKEGQTYFLVARYDFKPGDDEVWMWVNPDLSERPNTVDADSYIFGSSDTGQGTEIQFGVQGYGQNNVLLDEIRVGESWETVIGTPSREPETVGVMVTSLALGRNMLSSPFEPYPQGGITGSGSVGSASLDKIVGTQLTGHPVSQWASDKIEAWDADLQTYVGAWLRSGQGWTAWDTMDTSPAFGIDSDAGYWFKLNNVAKNVKLFGRVASEDRSIEMKINRNMVGSCFPVSCPLTESNLIGSLMTGHPVSQWASDKIEFWNAAAQTYVGVWYRSGQGWKAWNDMDNPPVAPYDAIDPCEGWWIKVNNTLFTWTYKAPPNRTAGD